MAPARGLLLLFAVACTPSERLEPAPLPVVPKVRSEGYSVALSPELDRIDVRACLPGARALVSADRRIALDERGCGSYTKELGEGASLRELFRVDGAVLASPDLWLFQPEPQPNAPLVARFSLPEGLRAAVPWPETAGAHRVPASTFRWVSQAAFGKLDVRELALGERSLRIVLVGQSWPKADADRVADWIADGARMTAATYGAFPVKTAHAFVLPPAGRSRSFGLAFRGGGASVVVTPAAGSLDDDWTAVHELLHLGIPQIELESAWLFEGIAQYYTAIARARAGRIGAEDAWWELLDGFERGKRAGTGRTLAVESADMHRTRAYWRVYWAGAALALLSDVELRRGGSSLDARVADLARCCAEAEDFDWRAVARRLGPYEALAERWLERADFPEIGPTLAFLGVKLAGDTARFDPRAPGAKIRDAITTAEATDLARARRRSRAPDER